MKKEIKERFGVLPNFFRTAKAAPHLMDTLWAFAKGAYLDLPIPSVFKERLFVYLSRFCEVRYCAVRHVGFLVGKGNTAGDAGAPHTSIEDAVALLARPYPSPAHLKEHVETLEAYDEPMKDWPEPGSKRETAIFSCASEIFLKPNVSQRYRFALRNALGNSNFEMFLGYLAFIRTAHFWTLVHPELEYEEDVETLLANHQTLSKKILQDPEAGSWSITQKFQDELNELRKEKKAYEQLKDSQSKLIEALHARDEFISIASHELKTPLTTLGLATEMMGMLENPEPEAVKKYVSQVSKYYSRLLKLVEDMLDISRIRSGEMRPVSVPTKFSEILQALVERMMPAHQSAAGGVKPRMTIEENIVGFSDPDRFEQLASNLLTNAIKYGEGKPVDIRLTSTENHIRLSIKDYGRGISEEKIQKIFSRFERAINKNEVSGLGLGLYIAKQITEALNGSISVESKLGEGSNFIVELPLIKKPKGKASETQDRHA